MIDFGNNKNSTILKSFQKFRWKSTVETELLKLNLKSKISKIITYQKSQSPRLKLQTPNCREIIGND